MQLMNAYFSICLIYIIAVLMILSYGLVKCHFPEFVDPLTIKLANTPYDILRDGWAISHFVLFMIVGYMYPQIHYMIFASFLGVLWEAIEYGVRDTSIFPSSCVQNMITNNSTRWWYGRWQDIVMNSYGLLVGAFIRATSSNN